MSEEDQEKTLKSLEALSRHVRGLNTNKDKILEAILQNLRQPSDYSQENFEKVPKFNDIKEAQVYFQGFSKNHNTEKLSYVSLKGSFFIELKKLYVNTQQYNEIAGQFADQGDRSKFMTW